MAATGAVSGRISVGGLVGLNAGSTAKLSYVYATGDVAETGAGQDFGGLVGVNSGLVSYAHASGDVTAGNSLNVGGLIGTIAVAVKHEIVLMIIGGLFVLETLSVIVQVASFKLTGKRVFRMAPIHHHFEQLGWSESQIVVRFWIIAFVLALVGLSTLKVR